jgi:hypothetical protein
MPSVDVFDPHSPSQLGLGWPRRLRQVLYCLCAMFFVASASFDAAATPEYPIVLDSYLRMRDPSHTNCDQLTRCLICHTTTRGGQATAVRPFASTLRMYGLNRGRDSAALLSALAQLPPMTDSDDDGLADIDELTICGNPSGADIGSGPQYGCDGAQLVPARSANLPLAFLALVAAGLIVQLRRAPSRRQG